MAGTVETVTLQQLSSWALRQEAQFRRLDYTKPIKQCEVVVMSDVKQGFNRATSPSGVPWQPIRPSLARRGGLGAKPLLDTGALRASIHSTTSSTELIVQTTHDYAAIHQHGGVIKPTNARMLSIPLTRDAASVDSPRRFPRQLVLVQREGKSPVLIESLPGTGKTAKGARSIAHYVLVPSVRIPARPFLGFSRQALSQCDAIFLGFLDDQIGRSRIGG